MGEKRWAIGIYWATISALILASFVLVSTYEALKGLELPWVRKMMSEGYTTYNVNAITAVIISLALATLFTFFVHRIARSKGSNYYYYGAVAVVVVVVVAALALYGGACGVCSALVCSWNVKECGIVWKNVFEIAVKCLCK